MQENERVQIGKDSKDREFEQTLELAHKVLANLVDAGWVIGYSAKERRKFVIRIADTPIGEDALRLIQPVIVDWYEGEGEES